jgi:hypothetical protein
MKRFILAMIILGTSHVLWGQSDTVSDEPPFEPAKTLSVTDFTVPLSSVASGTLVLDAVITDTGKVQKVEMRRDIASLTEVAVKSVKEWAFSPATFAGKAISSRMPVAVTVRPPLADVGPTPLPELKPQTEAGIQAAFQPAEVLHAVFPTYSAANQVYAITVVLEITLSATGKLKDAKVLMDAPPATADAEAALEDWRFMSATWNGHPVTSTAVVVFVFKPPVYQPR